MKIAKFFAVIFAVAGTLLMLGTVVLCLTSLDAPVRTGEIPAAARACSEKLMEAVAAGDYETAGNCLYGQPDLGAASSPADPVGALVWEGFLSSISYEFQGDCYVTDTGFARNATVTTLDIPSVTEAFKQRSQDLLAEQTAAATEPAELYGENGQFKDELITQVLRQAAQETLSAAPQTVTYEVTLHLIRRDGQWWAVPDQALLKAISGGVV